MPRGCGPRSESRGVSIAEGWAGVPLRLQPKGRHEDDSQRAKLLGFPRELFVNIAGRS